MKRIILVPVDYSKGAVHALKYATALAQKEKAEILLLHAFHFSFTSSGSGEWVGEDRDITQKKENEKLKALAGQVSKSGKVKCDYMVRYGLAVDAILDVVNEKKPQMIIMGTKGAGWLKEMIMGSNTATVIEKAKCPVIAVPESAEYNGIRKITYATDYHASDITALKKIVEIARPFEAELLVLHVSDEELTQDTDEMLMKKFEKFSGGKIGYDKIKYQIVHGKYLEKVLEQHIKNEKPDLLAMSTHYRSALDKIFGTSVTKKMAYHSQVPLLAFHHKHESVVFI